MKLRVKQGATTHRLQVDNSVHYGELKQILGTQLNLLPESIKLSLNKQVELVGGDEQSLKAQGVKGGDLLWLTHSQPTGQTDLRTTCREGESWSFGATTAPTPATTSELLAPPSATGSALREHPHQALPQDAMVLDGGQDTEEYIRPAWGLSDFLLHVQEANPQHTDLLTCAIHAAMLEAGLDPSWSHEGSDLYNQLRLPPSSRGVLRLSYNISPAEGLTGLCQLAITRMGDFHLITGKTQGHRTHTISLEGKHFCLAMQPAPGGKHCNVLRNERDLWIRVKDSLVRPVLADLRAALGLPAMVGFTSQPLELTDCILNHLDVKDLVSLIATCTVMRSAASADTHWERLTRTEFKVVPGDEDNARRWGWLRLYKSLYLEREACSRLAEDARRLERRRRPFSPFPPFGTGGPFARRPRHGGYRQIGGDYDRNPLQGSTPGWGPFLGGGGFGAGVRYA